MPRRTGGGGPPGVTTSWTPKPWNPRASVKEIPFILGGPREYVLITWIPSIVVIFDSPSFFHPPITPPCQQMLLAQALKPISYPSPSPGHYDSLLWSKIFEFRRLQFNLLTAQPHALVTHGLWQLSGQSSERFGSLTLTSIVTILRGPDGLSTSCSYAILMSFLWPP